MNEYFTEDEFKCKCGCGMDVSEDLKYFLYLARATAKTPFVINSGARCKAHNKAINGKETSSHTLGLAVDISATTSRERFAIINSLLLVGINRIGIDEKFIHCDIQRSKVNDVIWTY